MSTEKLCGACKKVVDGEINALQCNDPLCLKWYHPDCEGINEEAFSEVKGHEAPELWVCRVCSAVAKRLVVEREAFIESLESKIDVKVRQAVRAAEVRLEEMVEDDRSEREGLKRQVENLLVEIKKIKGAKIKGG